MGFAEEVSQARKATPAAVVTAAAESGAPTGPEHGSLALPTGTAPLEGDVVVQEPTVKATTAETPEVVPAPIKIAGKEFASVEAAMAYAEQLEIANREENAFKEGYDKAKGASAAPATAAKSLDDEVEEILFEDPKKAIQKLREGIQAEIWSSYNKMTAEQVAAKQAADSRQATWDEFYKSNTDLAESKDFVDFAMKQHWETLKDKPTTKALAELADIARKGLRISRDQALPKTTLQSRGAVMAGAGSSATTAAASVTSSEPLDFISQLTKLRKRGKQ